MKTYLVGGAVRDSLLGLPVHERDWVVVGATPAQMLAQGYRQVGADFPVFLHPQSAEEYALARTERKSGHGYQGFVVHAEPDVTLDEDLGRRDLTINAIARSEQGELIDPYGGSADLTARLLRHVSPAFAEDPLRVLRVARFHARFAPLGFSIATETRMLMRQMVDNGEVAHLTPERVWQEIHKALKTTRPSVFFETLRECGALKVLMPELDRLFGVPQPEKYHPEIDTGVHTWLVLDQAAAMSELTRVRFAALVHDLGKGTTPETLWPSHHGHEARGVELIDQLCDRFKVPNDHRELAKIVSRQHGNVHRAAELRPATVYKILRETDALRRPERFLESLLCCEADSRGRTGLEARPYPQAAYFARTLEAIREVSAQRLMAQGISGKALGEALDRERIAAIRAVTFDS